MLCTGICSRGRSRISALLQCAHAREKSPEKVVVGAVSRPKMLIISYQLKSFFLLNVFLESGWRPDFGVKIKKV